MVTGGAGFIGSALVHLIIDHTDYEVIVIDNLSYSGHIASLDKVIDHRRFTFCQGDIKDREFLLQTLHQHQPDAVMHLAAESHVDRSIDGPLDFIHTNVVGTAELLEATRHYLHATDEKIKNNFRFLHISTDEVFGDLGGKPLDEKFSETSHYNPSSPYSASKAASDHLVAAWGRTYGLPVLIANCSNNYGPRQFPEKFIPLIIHNVLSGKKIPIYGDGQQIRDWLYVEDHARALLTILEKGDIGEKYNIGANAECTNKELVHLICNILQKKVPNNNIEHYKTLITHINDRPGHDLRYGINADKIKTSLGWQPKVSFAQGLELTVDWYLNNGDWLKTVAADQQLTFDNSKTVIA